MPTFNLPLDPIGVVRANRLATDGEKAQAWNSLMSFTTSDSTNVDARAIQHAAETLRDIVQYRLANASLELR